MVPAHVVPRAPHADANGSWTARFARPDASRPQRDYNAASWRRRLGAIGAMLKLTAVGLDDN